MKSRSYANVYILCGSMSKWHGASSGSEWRRQPPGVERSWEYIE